MKYLIKASFLSLVLFSFFSITYAHNIGGNGFESGLTHPFLGLDHFLAMISVGILSTQMNKNSIWKLPLCFVSFMIIGGILGINNIVLSYLEIIIAFSVLIFGIMIFSQKNLSFISYLIVGFLAIFHGNAHGIEIPQITSPIFYVLGFIFSTTILHIIGILIQKLIEKNSYSIILLRYSGIIISCFGIYFMI